MNTQPIVDARAIIARLERFAPALPVVVSCVDEAEARWRPTSGAWSVLEIVNHMADEEVEDFRARLRSTLEDQARAWAPIDPEGWARERRYNERELAESVRRFVNARRESVLWLKGLRTADWGRTHLHPKHGPIAAGTLLASWAAHDALHLRQIAKRQHDLARRDAGTFPIDYAGPWTA